MANILINLRQKFYQYFCYYTRQTIENCISFISCSSFCSCQFRKMIFNDFRRTLYQKNINVKKRNSHDMRMNSREMPLLSLKCFKTTSTSTANINVVNYTSKYRTIQVKKKNITIDKISM